MLFLHAIALSLLIAVALSTAIPQHRSCAIQQGSIPSRDRHGSLDDRAVAQHGHIDDRAVAQHGSTEDDDW